jgi:hypothetical protein
MPRVAVEVPLPLDGAIVLARRIIQLNAYPVSICKMGITEETNDGLAAILEFDGLADL